MASILGKPLCPYGDRLCPCPDGLACHYLDTPEVQFTDEDGNVETFPSTEAWPKPFAFSLNGKLEGGHYHLSLFFGNNPGARPNIGTVAVRRDEYKAFVEAIGADDSRVLHDEIVNTKDISDIVD